jgi:hypothetical protein
MSETEGLQFYLRGVMAEALRSGNREAFLVAAREYIRIPVKFVRIEHGVDFPKWQDQLDVERFESEGGAP